MARQRCPRGPCVVIHMLLSCITGLLCGDGGQAEVGYDIVSLVETKSPLKDRVMDHFQAEKMRQGQSTCLSAWRIKAEL